MWARSLSIHISTYKTHTWSHACLVSLVYYFRDSAVDAQEVIVQNYYVFQKWKKSWTKQTNRPERECKQSRNTWHDTNSAIIIIFKKYTCTFYVYLPVQTLIYFSVASINVWDASMLARIQFTYIKVDDTSCLCVDSIHSTSLYAFYLNWRCSSQMSDWKRYIGNV